MGGEKWECECETDKKRGQRDTKEKEILFALLKMEFSVSEVKAVTVWNCGSCQPSGA